MPLDYGRPDEGQVTIALARVPATDSAHRIGSLFFNFGGPGASSVGFLQQAGAGFLARLNRRFDVVAFDPRGVGQSTPAIDCKVDRRVTGLSAQPFTTPFALNADALVAGDRAYVERCRALNGRILAHLSTADVARDLDGLRSAVGDRRLTYLGFSYGTVLGATYAAMFPRGFRALALDGPLDATSYLNDPVTVSTEQTAAFERELGRFFEACAADQQACSGFGGGDPRDAFDRLVAAANASPIPATGYASDPRPVGGDDLNAAAFVAMYAKRNWATLGQALATAGAGDGTAIRTMVDEWFYGRSPDGSFGPDADQFFTIYGGEAEWPHDVGTYLSEGAKAWGTFDHFWFNHGYSELPFGLYPIRAEDAYDGPFRIRPDAPSPLVIATTYDPATPYRGALRLVRDLGNARLLTVSGDGHTAYGRGSECVDRAVAAYLESLVAPPPGTTCQQADTFAAPSASLAPRERWEPYLGR